MILYYAITNYHILTCILHKLKYHTNEKAILYISKWHPEYENLILKLDNLHFFENVLVYEEVVFPSGNHHINKRQIECDIDFIVHHVPQINFKEYAEINVCGDHYGLGVFLVYNHINYNYFEDGCGILSNEELLMNNIKKFEYSRYQILKFLKIPGNAKCVLKRFGNLNKQLTNYFHKKDVHFSVIDELKEISSENFKKIFSIFCDDYKIQTFEDATLILTFHYVNLGILTLDEQRKFYGYLIDYFSCGKQVVIKPHPSDSQSFYNDWFPDAYVLPRKMPSEFLPFFVEKKFSSAVTGWSTSIYNLVDILKEVVVFNQEIDKTYLQLNQYYLVAYIIYIFFKNDVDAIFVKDVSCVQLKNIMNLFNLQGLNLKTYNDREMLVGCISNSFHIIVYNFKDFDQNKFKSFIKNLNDNDIVIFMFNTDMQFFNLLEILSENVIVFEIEKEVLNLNLELPSQFLQAEYVVCFTKNDNLKKKMGHIYFEKELNYTNIKLKISNNLYEIYKKNYYNKEHTVESLKKECKDLLEINKNFEQQIFDKNSLIEHLEKQNDSILNSNSWKITFFYRKLGEFIKKILSH